MSIYENCGLIETVYLHVTSLLRHSLLSIPAKSLKFARAYDDCYKVTFSQVDWQAYFEANKIDPLNPKIKQAIKVLLNRMGNEEWLFWLIQTHLLQSFYLYESNLSQPYKSKPFRLILEYYNFIRSEIEKQHILIPEPFNETPMQKYWRIEKEETRRGEIKRKKDEKISKRLCPHCGARGLDVKKWDSERYKCKICGRTFPRRQKTKA